MRTWIVPAGARRRRFLQLLSVDLRAAGIFCCFIRDEFRLTVGNETGKDNFAKLTPLGPRKSLLHRNDKKLLRQLLIPGPQLDIARINPVVEVCRSRETTQLFTSIRMSQAVASGERVGRRIKALIFDRGQRTETLMGVIGLASSLYTLACRDRYFGWTPNASGMDRKNKGLRRLMDLSSCVPLPPYSYLFGGKLLSLLSTTDIFTKEFHSKYGDQLHAIVTTCATGLHCPIFNRIMIRKGGLYRRIGETSGYTTVHFRHSTIDAARDLIKIRLGKTINNPMRTLRTAFNFCQLPADVLLKMGNSKGVYLAFLSRGRIDCLKRGICGNIHRTVLTESNAIRFWRNHLLNRAIIRDDIMTKVKTFERKSFL